MPTEPDAATRAGSNESDCGASAIPAFSVPVASAHDDLHF
jgi:hypothetical protein